MQASISIPTPELVRSRYVDVWSIILKFVFKNIISGKSELD